MAAGLRPRFCITPADRGCERFRNLPLRRKYRGMDFAIARYLVELGRYHRSLSKRGRLRPGWLMGSRRDFRQMIACRPCAGLREFLGVCPPEHPSFLIAIWLLGRCATRQATFDLERLPADGSPTERKHFARALHRVESWPRLRQLAADYSDDPNVAATLARPGGKNFARRLERFATHVDTSHADEAAVASQMPLWVRDEEWHRIEPKSPSWIRIVLERIKQWVRGESVT